MPYSLFLKKRQNFKLSSAAKYRWHFKGYDCCLSADVSFEGEPKHAFNSDECLIGLLKFVCPSLFLRKASDIFSRISFF